MFPVLINKVSTFHVGAKALILVVSRSLLHNHFRSLSINRLVTERSQVLKEMLKNGQEDSYKM